MIHSTRGSRAILAVCPAEPKKGYLALVQLKALVGEPPQIKHGTKGTFERRVALRPLRDCGARHISSQSINSNQSNLE